MVDQLYTGLEDGNWSDKDIVIAYVYLLLKAPLRCLHFTLHWVITNMTFESSEQRHRKYFQVSE